MTDGKVPDNHQEGAQPAQQTTQQQTATPASQGQSSSTHPGQGTANIGLTPDSVPLLVPPPTSSNISGSHDLSDSEVTDGDGGLKTDGKQNLTPINTRKRSTSRMCEMEFKIAGQLARMKLISDKETLSSVLDATSGVHILKARNPWILRCLAIGDGSCGIHQGPSSQLHSRSKGYAALLQNQGSTVKTINHTKSILKLNNVPTYLWTDSAIALTWIQSHPSRWKDFVRNRVSQIQDLIPDGHWKFVPGLENPADCATRGLTTLQLKSHQLWWTGPPWLLQDSSSWPLINTKLDSNTQLEERPVKALYSTTKPLTPRWSIMDRPIPLLRMLRATAICWKVLDLIKKRPNSSLAHPITSIEIKQALQFCIKETQRTHFYSELKMIKNQASWPRDHPFARLTVFLDTEGIIRVGGRLENAPDSDQLKHPAILPRDAALSKLINSDAHQRTMHGGTQLTLAYTRQRYWIIGGRQQVRTQILKCLKCARHRGIRAQQLMGQLPAPNVTPGSAFAHTGVDYAGPVQIKTTNMRGSRTYKGWICHFTGSHMGGKWEAAVKSMKHHLTRTIGESSFTFEEFTTLLHQVEAILNSRPLEPLSQDPQDLSALTSGHLLIGRALNAIPGPSLLELNIARLSRWQFIQQRIQCFWKHWSNSYIQRHLSQTKWHRAYNNTTIGSLVLLTDERTPPTRWPLARVTAVHPGNDELIRVATIETVNGTLTRPITKLAVLPLAPEL
ncbi:uncharacterized protein LOC141535395 [Cotesia typhae]|uniref:uncharacterized protein LOC141535395 n=1 Tax=Cotesia typhae TaxID=2053667 RepID=UPI003D6984A3